MICICNNGKKIEIARPSGAYEQILGMIVRLSDESDNLPFTSEDFGITAGHLQSYIESLNERDNSIFLVARDEGSVVGFAYLEGGRRARTHHCANLGIGILKTYQGIGIGQALVEQLITYAQGTESIAKIDLQVRKDNVRAVNLYKKFGFAVEGVNRRALFIENSFYDYIMMGKIID